MANSIVRKIINYLKVPYLTAPERRVYEKLYQEIVNNPDKLTKITTTNVFEYGYVLNGATKMIISRKDMNCDGYAMMPNGQAHNLYFTEPIQKILIETADRVARRHNISYAKISGSIGNYFNDFCKKHTR